MFLTHLLIALKGHEFASGQNVTDSVIQIWKVGPGTNKAQTRVNQTLKPLNLSLDLEILPLNCLVIFGLNISADHTKGTWICKRSKFYGLTHPNVES